MHISMLHAPDNARVLARTYEGWRGPYRNPRERSKEEGNLSHKKLSTPEVVWL